MCSRHPDIEIVLIKFLFETNQTNFVDLLISFTNLLKYYTVHENYYRYQKKCNYKKSQNISA